MVHYIPFIHSLNLLSIHLIHYPFTYLLSIQLLLFVHLHFSPFSYNTQLHCPNSFKCTLYLPHIYAYLYMYYIFVFFVRITLVNLHSNLRTSQGKARLKPSLRWAGIPCLSVYLLSRRGNSQVEATRFTKADPQQPGGSGLLGSTVLRREKYSRYSLTDCYHQSFCFSWNKLLYCTNIFSICCAMEKDNPTCDEVEVSHRQRAKQAIGGASSYQSAEIILEEDYSENFKSVSHQSRGMRSWVRVRIRTRTR